MKGAVDLLGLPFALMRGRELKSVLCRSSGARSLVRPHARAGVEIHLVASKCIAATHVRPHARAGVEMV